MNNYELYIYTYIYIIYIYGAVCNFADYSIIVTVFNAYLDLDVDRFFKFQTRNLDTHLLQLL